MTTINYFAEKEKALRVGHSAIEDMRFCIKAEKGCIINGNELRNYFQYNFNELKGETMQGELERWLNFVFVVENTRSRYDYKRDEYYFTPNTIQ